MFQRPYQTSNNTEKNTDQDRPRLEFDGNNGDNNNGNKTGAMHGPLIDEGISLVAFWAISLLGGCLRLREFFFLL
jgi:hypothetical protein